MEPQCFSVNESSLCLGSLDELRAITLDLLGSTYGKTEKFTAPVLRVGSVRITQISVGGTKDAGPRESFAKIHSEIRMRILFFYPSNLVYRQEESRQ
jgi:hypothetical protein